MSGMERKAESPAKAEAGPVKEILIAAQVNPSTQAAATCPKVKAEKELLPKQGGARVTGAFNWPEFKLWRGTVTKIQPRF